MKRLSPATIKRYTPDQLASHLDRLGSDSVRVSKAAQTIHTLDSDLNGYYFYCAIANYNRYELIQLIHDTYSELGM